MNWSIERKLPLFVSGLLLAVVLGLLTIGYGEVRRAARLIASERLQRATAAWAVLFQRAGEQQRTATTALAADLRGDHVPRLRWPARTGASARRDASHRPGYLPQCRRRAVGRPWAVAAPLRSTNARRGGLMLEPGLAYVEKPFRPATLLRKVREVLQNPAS
ncbi:MAG TPA: hypothetical protein VGQ29_10315 [Gemmatimonadales bacterium]|jgi:hypothetical protein|nr:hypothetical protein [Gemmatimonadales bacterium]